MLPTRRKLLASTAAALSLSGCLGGGGGGGGATTTTEATTTTQTTSEATTTTTTTAAAPTVQVRSHPDHGDILTDADGMTLYMFDNDTQGSGESACSGGCANAWPPLTVEGDPTAGDGVTAELTTFERSGGDTQVAAGGWPLYYYSSDEQAGDAKGQGVGDVWWVLAPDGSPRRAQASTTTTSDPPDGDGGDGGDY